jgi:hypothetical protein
VNVACFPAGHRALPSNLSSVACGCACLNDIVLVDYRLALYPVLLGSITTDKSDFLSLLLLREN